MAELAADDFNRTNESPLASPWAAVPSLGTLRLVSNMIQTVGADGDAAARYTGVTWPADHYSEVVIGAASPQDCGPAVRMSDTEASCYFATSDGSWCFIYKFVDGLATEIETYTGLGLAWTTGDLVRLDVAGSTLTLSKNGTPLGTPATDTDLVAGDAGVFMYDDAARITSWAGGGEPISGALSGRGSVAIAAPAWLRVELSGIPAGVSTGQAEPPNLYHVGMLSWGTESGVMTAHILTRETELIQLPAGMTALYYQFASGIEAVITELAEP